MTRLILVLVAISVTACDAPTSGFRGGEVSRHQIGGAAFTVYVKGGQAQAVRTNRQYAPRVGPLAGQAVVAMQRASGCRVTEVAGDAAVLVGRLSCKAKKWPACDVDALLKGRRGLRVPVRETCPGA